MCTPSIICIVFTEQLPKVALSVARSKFMCETKSNPGVFISHYDVETEHGNNSVDISMNFDRATEKDTFGTVVVLSRIIHIYDTLYY